MDNVRLALLAATIGMETAWLFAAVAMASVVIGLPVAALSPVGVGVLLALAWGVAWVLDQIDIPLWKAQLAGAAIGVLAVTLVAQASSGVDLAPWEPFWFMAVLTDRTAPTGFGVQTILATLGALLVWWRGVRLAQRLPGFEPVLFAFRLGLAVVAAEAVFEAFLPTAVGAAWNVVPYFALGLMTLALAHLEEVGRTQRGDAARWLWLPPAVIVTMALLTMGVVLGAYTALWDLLLWLIRQVDFVLETLFLGVLLALGLIVEVLINVLRWFVAQIGANPADPRMMNFGQFLEDLRRQQGADEEMIALMTAMFKYTVMIIFGTLAVWWLARALGRRGLREERPEVERESLWTDRTLVQDVNAFANAMLRLFRKEQPAWAGLGDDPRGVVLRSYLQSLALAEQRGSPRPPQQTPAEFVPEMKNAFPAAEESTAALTTLFETARYGDAPVAEEDGQLAAALADDLRRTVPPRREKESGGGRGGGGEQEISPTDLLGPQWRGERMGG